MDRFQELSIFVAVAEEEGFAAAARRLHMSPPPVTRAITSLETRLGVTLLNRTTRYVRVTEAGERYLEEARRILAALAAADETASGNNATPSGSLSITAPILFGKLHVIPGVVDYLTRYPDTQVSVALLDRVVNLLEEGFDAGLRIGELPDSTMRALRVGFVRTLLCASPDYLKEHGTPRTVEQLHDHTIISIAGSNALRHWRFNHNGKTSTIKLKSRLSVTNNDAAITAANADFGLVRVLSYQVESCIAEGRLIPVLEKFEPPPSPVNIIHREGREVSATLRAFIDVLANRLRASPVLNSRVMP